MQETQRLTLHKADLPLDILVLIVSYLEINKLLIPMLINKDWHRATLPRWRELLFQDFEVDPDIARMLPHPNMVYRKISQAISDRYDNYAYFIAKYGLTSFCICLDVEDKQQLAEFFRNNTIPDLADVAYLGNLSVVKYLIEDCNRSFILAIEPAKMSGSIPLLLYFIEQWGLYDTSRNSDYCNYCLELPPDLGQLFRHWNKISSFMSYKTLALTGSIAAIKKMDSTQDRFPDLDTVLRHAIDSGSLILLKYLYEDPSCPFRQRFDQQLKDQLYEIFKLDRAASRGKISIVQYMREVRRIKFTHQTMLAAVRSGSLVVAKYVREHAEEKTLNDDIYPFTAIQSGSLRMVRYQREVCKRQNSTKNDLDIAAELGLTNLLTFILNHRPPPADQTTREHLLRSKFATLKILPNFPTIQFGQKDLIYFSRHNNLFFVRQVVEEKKLLPDEETKNKISLNVGMCTKVIRHDNAKYLMNVTPRNNSTSFWNKVLSFPCKNTVDKLTSEILFDNKGKLQKWFSPSFVLLRKIRGRLYVNTVKNPCDYLTVTDEPEEKPNVISIEVTWVMAAIVNITKDLPEITLKKPFLETEQMYLRALQEIQVKLEEGLSSTFEPPAALAFYRRWHRIIAEAIANNKETETGIDPKCSLGATQETSVIPAQAGIHPLRN